MLDSGASVNGFGIGARMDTSSDFPYFDCAYKHEEYASKARRNRSEGEQTWLERKQVFRRNDGEGRMSSDIVTVEGDHQHGQTLIKQVMREGKRIIPAVKLDEIRRKRLKVLTV